MKTKAKTNSFIIIKQITLLWVIIFFAYACGKEIVPPQAEITKIYNITDNSATVDVKVTKQSNAWAGEYFSLSVDSISKKGEKTQVQYVYFAKDSDSLNNFYTAKISNLKSKTQYYLYLIFSGYYDIGGPNQTETDTIGTTKTFTTN